ncbi:MAG: UDP-N-acetylglucosamine diphosphorylase/glucosamine-1-phosphate N-acetyltransferase [Methylococcus sp.]|nr:MAG: UDP-N-acetylglucosamine diphosphorylase/glucosamine-1-phosphate N-acetyltransferase [Methylococcus sp.]
MKKETGLKTIILAAGQGTRMKSVMPKVLHRIAGRPLLEHVHGLAAALGSEDITIVYGHQGDKVRQQLNHLKTNWVEQREQLGTGHAVMQVSDALDDEQTVLVLYGDVPLLRKETVQRLLAVPNDNTLGLLTVVLRDPSGYGRIVRNAETQRVERIVEENDATPEEKDLSEVNTGIMALPGLRLKKWLSELDNTNAQGEYYLTDVVALAVEDGCRVDAIEVLDEDEVLGVNDRIQLAHLERVLQQRQARALMAAGVTLADPSRFDVRGEIVLDGQDIEIDINVIVEGTVSLGRNVRIGPNCVLKNCTVGDHVEIMANSVIEGASIGSSSRIGPFARIRPGTELGDHVHVGNFVEIKKSVVNSLSKINHLSYIGDSTVGSRVNIGAGTITCNYDGANKSRTVIEDDVFVGSDTQLVAPVRLGRNSTIGAGSTITKDTPEGQLSLSRSRQVSVKGWVRPRKKGS